MAPLAPPATQGPDENAPLGNRERVALVAALIMPTFALVVAFCRTDLTAWDMIAHVRSAAYYRDHLWPAFYGWNADQGFGGYPEGYFYPPLFAWLVGGLGKVIPLAWAFRVLLGASVMALPLSVLFFVRAIEVRPRPRAAFGAVYFTMTALLVSTPKSFGGFFSATFVGGLVTAQWSLPFVLFYLAALKRLVAGWRGALEAAALLSLVVLSHGFNGLSTVLLSAIYFPFFCGRLGAARAAATRYVAHLLLALALTAVWVAPCVAYHAWTNGKAITSFDIWTGVTRGLWFYVPAAALLLVACLRALGPEARVWRGLVAPVLVLLALYWPLKAIHALGLARGFPLHSYRLLLFAFLFGGLSSGYAWAAGRASRPRVAVAALVFLAATVGFLTRTMGISRRDLGVASEALPSTRGLVDESLDSELTRRWGSPHLVAARLEERGASLLNGVFVESSAVSPFVFGLLREIDPRGYVGTVERIPPEPRLAPWHESLLGLQWFLTDRTSVATGERGSGTPSEVDFVLRTGGAEQTLARHLYEVDTKLAEFVHAPPRPVPQEEWNDAVRAWWERGSDAVGVPVRAMTLPGVFELPRPTDRVELRQLASDRYELDVESDAPQWVYVKVPYFPTWHASTEDGSVPLYEASVHMMVVYGKGHIVLSSRPGLLERTTGLISLCAWGAVLLALLPGLSMLERVRRTARAQGFGAAPGAVGV